MRNKRIGYLHEKYRNPKDYSDDMHSLDINTVLAKYKEKAKTVKAPDWYVKDVALYFTFDEEAYVIDPTDIDTSREIFELLSDDLAEALYAVGAYDIFCSGVMD